jgi:uncharacterized membrane protein
MLVGASLCDGLSWALGGALFTEVARVDLLLGLIASVPAVGSGLWDLRRLPRDDGPTIAAAWHISAMSCAVILYLVSYLMRRDPSVAGSAIAVGFVGLVALGFGGFLGGELVHRFGVGRVSSTPEPAPPSHAATRTDPSPRHAS